MCVAYPGTVIEVKDRSAVVDFSGTKVEAMCGLVRTKPGDRVLVHAGCILEVLPKEDADEMQNIFDELAALDEDDLREKAPISLPVCEQTAAASGHS